MQSLFLLLSRDSATQLYLRLMFSDLWQLIIIIFLLCKMIHEMLQANWALNSNQIKLGRFKKD